MNDNPDLSSPSWKSGPQHKRGAEKKSVQEEILKTAVVQVERKTFQLILKENSRGRFLRISEEAQGRRNAIIIPAPGLADFQNVVETMCQDLQQPQQPSAPAGE